MAYSPGLPTAACAILTNGIRLSPSLHIQGFLVLKPPIFMVRAVGSRNPDTAPKNLETRVEQTRHQRRKEQSCGIRDIGHCRAVGFQRMLRFWCSYLSKQSSKLAVMRPPEGQAFVLMLPLIMALSFYFMPIRGDMCSAMVTAEDGDNPTSLRDRAFLAFRGACRQCECTMVLFIHEIH